MRRHDVTPLSQIDRRAPEAGRIRLGVKSGKAMRSIDTFRFTSPNRQVIEQIAVLYGGQARPWSDPRANPSNQFEVITESADVRVMLTPDGLSTSYELWAGSGCERRCDGVECEVPRRVDGDYEMVTVPCICTREGVRECKPITRLQVVLPDVPFTGVWRMETKGWNALHELPGMYELIQSLAAQGRLVEARLQVERRERVTPAGKRNYVVPRLAIGQNLDQLMSASGTSHLAIGAGSTSSAAPAPPLPAAPVESEIVDAELIDDELLELEQRLRSDATNFGLNADAYVAAVKAQAENDRARIRLCIDQVRSGHIEPTGFSNGRVAWLVHTIKET